MENVHIDVSDDQIVITIDPRHRGSRSPSGKTVRVASTEGNITIPGTDLKLGLNCYVK